MKTTTTGTAAKPGAALLSGVRYSGLDGLRALAVLLVMAFHLLPGPVPGGYLGVDVFFVISGFLITGLLLRERDATGRIHLGSFWGRRARRLLPALALLLLACCAAALALGGDRLLDLGAPGAGRRDLQQQLALDRRRLELLRPRARPSCSATCGRSRSRSSSTCSGRSWCCSSPSSHGGRCGSGCSWRLPWHPRSRWRCCTRPSVDPTRVYYGTDTHSFGLALGAALAVLDPVVAGVPRCRGRAPHGSGLPLLGWIALAALLVLSLWDVGRHPVPVPGRPRTRVTPHRRRDRGRDHAGLVASAPSLELRPMRWIGERSYGLYLWHWPVWVLLTDATATLTGPALSGPVEAWIVGALAGVVTFAAASLSYDLHRAADQGERLPRDDATLGDALAARGSGRGHRCRDPRRCCSGSALPSTLALLNDPGQSELESQLAAAKVAIEERAAEADADAAADAAANPADPAQIATGDRITALGDSVMLAASPQLYEQFPGISWMPPSRVRCTPPQSSCRRTSTPAQLRDVRAARPRHERTDRHGDPRARALHRRTRTACSCS